MDQAEEIVALRGQVAELQRALAEEKAGWARAVGHFNGAEMAETVINYYWCKGHGQAGRRSP